MSLQGSLVKALREQYSEIIEKYGYVNLQQEKTATAITLLPETQQRKRNEEQHQHSRRTCDGGSRPCSGGAVAAAGAAEEQIFADVTAAGDVRLDTISRVTVQVPASGGRGDRWNTVPAPHVLSLMNPERDLSTSPHDLTWGVQSRAARYAQTGNVLSSDGNPCDNSTKGTTLSGGGGDDNESNGQNGNRLGRNHSPCKNRTKGTTLSGGGDDESNTQTANLLGRNPGPCRNTINGTTLSVGSGVDNGNATTCFVLSNHQVAAKCDVPSTPKVLVLYEEELSVITAESFGRTMLADAYSGTNVFQRLQYYEVVVAIEAHRLLQEGLWSTLADLAPQVHEEYGEDAIEQWVTNANILLLIFNWPVSGIVYDEPQEHEDVDENDTSNSKELLEIETLQYYMNELTNANFIILTSTYHVNDVIDILTHHISVATVAIKISSIFDNPVCNLAWKNIGVQNLDVCEEGTWKLPFPLFFSSRQFYVEMLRKYPKLRNTTSICEFFWTIVETQLSVFEKCNRISRNTTSELLVCISCLAYESECSDGVIIKHRDYYNFTENIWIKFIKHMLFPISNLAPAEGHNYRFLNGYFKHVLAAWHIYSQQKPLLSAISRTRCGDSVAEIVGGHLYRFITQHPTSIDDKTTSRLLKNLYIHSESSRHPQTYIVKLLNELNCHMPLVEILFRNVVFSRQLDLLDSAFIPEAVQCFMEYAEPIRLVVISQSKNDYHAQAVKDILDISSQMNINICIAMMNHLIWDNTYNSDDHFGRVLLSNSKARLHDFFGSLTITGIQMITVGTASHLTCLRVRVTSVEATIKLFNVHLTLPNLLWFEADFDLPLPTLFQMNLPRIITPLCDVFLRDVVDSNIIPLVDFLCKLRSNYYSAVHITRSSLSASATIRLLQELGKRHISLCTPFEHVKRYRRWRYRELAVLTPKEMQDEEKVFHLLGYDDRHQYSEFEVQSCHVASLREITHLKHVMQTDEVIDSIEYACRNVLVKKTTKGTVCSGNLFIPD